MNRAINEKFNKFLIEGAHDINEIYDLYENDMITEGDILRALNPALQRSLDIYFNKDKMIKALNYYATIAKEFGDNHKALLAASKETHIEYRTLEKVLKKLIQKGTIPKKLAISEEINDLSDLINTMDGMYETIKKEPLGDK